MKVKLSYLEPIVGPGAKLHEAVLLIEGEVPHVDLARGLEDGRRGPRDPAVVVQYGLRHRRDDVLPVGTDEGEEKKVLTRNHGKS